VPQRADLFRGLLAMLRRPLALGPATTDLGYPPLRLRLGQIGPCSRRLRRQGQLRHLGGQRRWGRALIRAGRTEDLLAPDHHDRDEHEQRQRGNRD